MGFELEGTSDDLLHEDIGRLASRRAAHEMPVRPDPDVITSVRIAPMVKLTDRRVGSSHGVLPSATTRALKVNEGDTLFLVASPDGFRITPGARTCPTGTAFAASTRNTSAHS